MVQPSRPSRGGALADLIGAATSQLKPEERRPAPSPTAGSSIVEVDAAKTRMNDLHRRSAATMGGAAIAEMVEMFKATGQTVPALGWRLATPTADGVEIVLVYGARRRAAALELGRPLRIELLPAEPSLLELTRLMHGENRGRLDYLPLEDAREYRAYLDGKVFRTADEMAKALGVSPSSVSRVLSLLDLPKEVLDLYTDPTWLPMVKGARLASAAADKAVRGRLLAAAQDWKAAGGRGDPTPTLVKALTSKPAAALAVELKGASGRAVGSFRGSVVGKGPFLINLGTEASEEVRRELADILNKHYKTKL